MTNSPSKFEQQLKQLRPSGSEQLATQQANTFYRAGWEACQSQFASGTTRPAPPKSGAKRRRPLAFFGAGLLCGLLVSVGLTAWQFSQATEDADLNRMTDSVSRQTPIVMPHSIQPDQTAARKGVDQVPPVVSDQWSEMVSGLLPWQISEHKEQKQFTPPSQRPLSLAARHQWRRGVVESRLSTNGHSTDGSIPVTNRNQLRSFPATQKVLDEYL